MRPWDFAAVVSTTACASVWWTLVFTDSGGGPLPASLLTVSAFCWIVKVLPRLRWSGS